MQFESTRLTMRPVHPKDRQQSLNHWQDPTWTRYIGSPLSATLAAERFERTLQPWSQKDGKRWVLSIERKNDFALVGELMFRHLPEHPGVGEIGYGLYKGYLGQGYAFEAASRLVEHLFSRFELHKLIAICDSRNTASWRLLEKLSMRREAHCIGHKKIAEQLYDIYYYGLLQSEFSRTGCTEGSNSTSAF